MGGTTLPTPFIVKTYCAMFGFSRCVFLKRLNKTIELHEPSSLIYRKVGAVNLGLLVCTLPQHFLGVTGLA